MISSLYDYFLKNPDRLPGDMKRIAEEDGVREAVKDHIAGMTDRYALAVYTDLFVPRSWK